MRHAAEGGREGDGHGDLRNPRKGADSGSRGAGGAIRSHNMCMEVLGSWREEGRREGGRRSICGYCVNPP